MIHANLTPKWSDARYTLSYEDAMASVDQKILFEVWDYDRIGKVELSHHQSRFSPSERISRLFHRINSPDCPKLRH